MDDFKLVLCCNQAWESYVTGGILTEQKPIRKVSFKSLEESFADPGAAHCFVYLLVFLTLLPACLLTPSIRQSFNTFYWTPFSRHSCRSWAQRINEVWYETYGHSSGGSPILRSGRLVARHWSPYPFGKKVWCCFSWCMVRNNNLPNKRIFVTQAWHAALAFETANGFYPRIHVCLHFLLFKTLALIFLFFQHNVNKATHRLIHNIHIDYLQHAECRGQ